MELERCPDCPDQGWYGLYRGHGDNVQIQCEFCWTNEKVFFITRMI